MSLSVETGLCQRLFHPLKMEGGRIGIDAPVKSLLIRQDLQDFEDFIVYTVF